MKLIGLGLLFGGLLLAANIPVIGGPMALVGLLLTWRAERPVAR